MQPSGMPVNACFQSVLRVCSSSLEVSGVLGTETDLVAGTDVTGVTSSLGLAGLVSAGFASVGLASDGLGPDAALV